MNHTWSKRKRNATCINCGLVRLTVERPGLRGWWGAYCTPTGKALGFIRPPCPGETYVVCW